MKKLHPLLSVLFLISVGFGQQIISQITETYNDGSIKSITYHKKIGNGLSKVKEEGYYKGGLQIYEYNYYDGVKDGLQTEWFNNGQKKYEGTYEDGRHVGSVTMWYENGQKKEEINYTDGEKIGSGTGWYDNGKKEYEITYKDGDLISYKHWNEDGSVRKEPFDWE